MVTTQQESHPSDGQLLQRYLGGGNPEAVAAIVRRHAGFVYSVALRHARDRHLAEDVTQAVFMLLVKKAAALRDHGELSGWLFNATLFEARNLLKARGREARRIEAHGREQAARGEATTMQHPEPWADVEPHLNDALEDLGEGERQAVMMRYLRQNSYDAVGGALGVSPVAARQRVHRALDRMRGFLKRRGVVVSSIGVLAEGMRLHGVQAAPAGLVASTVEATNQLSASLTGSGGVATAPTGAAVVAAVAAGSLKAKLVAALIIVASAGALAGAVAFFTRGGRGGQTVFLDPAPGGAGGAGGGRPTAPSGPVVRPAFKLVRAPSHDEGQGTREVGGFVGYINRGDWLRYNRVDLGPPAGAGETTFTAQVACPAQFAGNKLEVRLDSLDGPLLATLTVKSTGGHVWRPQSVPAAAHPGGVRDIFLKFSGGGWNLDTFNFTPASRSGLGPIDAVAFNEALGVQTRQEVVCEAADGYWVRYTGLDFGGEGVDGVKITYSCENAKAGGEIVVRLDHPGGPVVGRLKVTGTGGNGRYVTRVVPLEATAGRRDVVLAFAGSSPGIASVSRIEFVRGAAAATRASTGPATTTTSKEK
ncbi:MAG: sigma-70 family RNA polymerase sigma factor [Phycisphaerae bacterium]